MLRYSYIKSQMLGRFYCRNKKGKAYTTYLCSGNVRLWVELFFYRDESNEEFYQLMGFWDGVDHIKRAFKDGGSSTFTREVVKLQIFADALTGDVAKAIKLYAEAGVKVEVIKRPKQFASEKPYVSPKKK